MKIEKRPRRTDLNPRQKEIVEEHRKRNALKNATPEERAKRAVMQNFKISEDEYEGNKQAIENTLIYQKLLIKYSIRDFIRWFQKEITKV